MSDLFIISTTKTEAPTKTLILLGKDFSKNFFPIFIIQEGGKIEKIIDVNELNGRLPFLIIIPDNQEIHEKFCNWLGEKLNLNIEVYILLHTGDGTDYDSQECSLLNCASEYISKLNIAYDHHTKGYVLGDNLESIISATNDDRNNDAIIQEALSNLKNKPLYMKPQLEGFIKVYSALNIIKLKLDNSIINEKDIHEEMTDLFRDRFVKTTLGSEVKINSNTKTIREIMNGIKDIKNFNEFMACIHDFIFVQK